MMKITKVRVGNHEIKEVQDVQVLIQNEGDYILKGLLLQIAETKENTSAKLEKIFSGEIPVIEVFGSDALPGNSDPIAYGPENKVAQYEGYTGMKSISYHLRQKQFTVNLSMSAARIADNKYKELLAERDKLSKDIDDLNVTIAELIGTKEGA